MKKLTAGIFTVLLGLVTVNAADAAVASRGYVLQEVGRVDKSLTDYMTANDQAIADMDAAYKLADTAINDKIGTVTEGKTVVGMIEEAKSAASTGASTALNEYKTATDKKIADMDAAYKQADKDMDAAYKLADTNIGTRIDGVESAYATADEAINQTITANKQAADAELAKKEDLSNKVDVINKANEADATKYTSVKAVVDHVNVVKSELSLGASGLDTRLTTAEGDIADLFDVKADKTAVAQDIATAKSEAIADAETKNTALETSLKTYVDGKDTAQTQALATAKSDLEGQIATATSGAGSNLAAAKTELEGKITTAETNAKDYALTKANAAMDASVKYTDDVVSGLKLADIARVPAACSNAANYCALTTNGTNFIWEVIERASGETIDDTPVTVPATVAATKPTALTE